MSHSTSILSHVCVRAVAGLVFHFSLKDISKHVHVTCNRACPQPRTYTLSLSLPFVAPRLRCCQFDDRTRQLAEITYKDALEQHGCLDLEDLQYEAEFLTWDQASQNLFTFACHLTSTIKIRVSWDPFNPDWIASATNTDLAQVMIDTQHFIHIQLINEQKWAKVVGLSEEGKQSRCKLQTAKHLV